MLLSIVFIVGAIILLYFGAEFSLDASEKVGKKIGLSPLVIGMLLVGFGTSLPELFVGHIAGARGEVGIALGSLVGSNIANLFLVLGISAFIAKLSTKGKSLREHLGIHLLLSIALFFVLNQTHLTLLTASPLLGVLVIYLFFIFKDMKRSEEVNRNSEEKELDTDKNSILLLKMIIGFFLLYVGGELLVKGGTDFGVAIGIETYIISSIFIAFGTSFPELVTAVMAAVKKKDTDIIIGNIIGSNLFNCALILGSLGVYNFEIAGDYSVELFSLLFGSGFLLLLSFLNKTLAKAGSILFVMVYLGVVGHWLKFL